MSAANVNRATPNNARRVFGYWAVVVTGGFIATQLHQEPDINSGWLVSIVLGLVYMKLVMPFAVPALKRIWWLWAVALVGGLFATGGAVHLAAGSFLVPYLGVFWLALMGAAHMVNGYLDNKPGIYLFSGALQLVAAVAILMVPSLLMYQYYLTALVGGLGMLWLALYATGRRPVA